MHPIHHARLLPIALCLWLFGCGGEPDKPKKPGVLEVVLPSAPSEAPAGDFLEPPRLSHREVVAQLRSVAEQARLKGLLLRMGDLGSAWARAQDIRRALAAIREAGKPVHCHFEGTDNLGYAVMATSCDQISMAPGGLLNLVGLRAQGVYAQEALDTLGLTAELLHVGKYKGAADSLTLNAMPDTARETMDAMLDDLHASLVEQLTKREGISADTVQAVLDGGPYPAADAIGAGLVDRIAYDDEARQRTRTAASIEHVERAPRKPGDHEGGLSELMSALSGEDPRRIREPHLALGYVEGTIIRGDAHEQGGNAATPFVSRMRKWADDDDVRAVVLRIHSPGGSALASDLMWKAVRRVAKRKPVIVSIGDMAASGGYYIACAGTEIFAEEESLVGSIGVVGGKIVAQPLAERLGVHSETLRRGQNAGWSGPLSRFTDSERAAVQRMLASTYDLFVKRVSLGRDLPVQQVETVAQGRLMTGKRGLQGKLVDSIGGIDAATARARELANLSDDCPVDVWPSRQGIVDQIAAAMGADPDDDAEALTAMRALWASRLQPWRSLPQLKLLLAPGQGPAALLPYALDIR